MVKAETYESYPLTGVILCNLFDAIIAVLGALIILPYGLHVSILYLIYVLYQEFSIFREGCVHCYYYGKRCFCGKGVCAAKMFKKGDPKVFTQSVLTWKSMLPMFMITILPIVLGVILLVIEFDWILLGMIVAIGVLGFPAQAITHGWACKYCKQREIGCPACDLFGGKK